MGLEGSAVEKWETYTQSHEHTDSATTVTQVPDIRQGDQLIVGSDKFAVIGVANWPATLVTGAFLQIVLEEKKP
jgi:hypothetical protein